MFCRECGNQIPDDAMFCEYCGTPTANKLSQSASSQTSEAQNAPTSGTQNVPVSNTPHQASSRTSSSGSGGIAAAIIIAVVLTGAVGAAGFVFKDKLPFLKSNNDILKATEETTAEVSESSAPSEKITESAALPAEENEEETSSYENQNILIEEETIPEPDIPSLDDIPISKEESDFVPAALPMDEDFEWFEEIAAADDFPDDIEFIDHTDEIEGKWNTIMYDFDTGTKFDEDDFDYSKPDTKHYLYYEIVPNGNEYKLMLGWQQMDIIETGEIIDQSNDHPFAFDAKWENDLSETLYAYSDLGNIYLKFYKKDGRLYGVGAMEWNSGETSAIGMVK